MSFGEELHRLRTEAGISIPDLAARTGIFSDYLAEIEAGQDTATAHTVEKVTACLRELGISEDDLASLRNLASGRPVPDKLKGRSISAAYVSTGTVGWLAIAFILLTAAFESIVIAYGGYQKFASLSVFSATGLDLLLGRLADLSFLLEGLAGLSFMTWFYLAARNLSALGVRWLDHSPFEAFYFIVPIAQFYVPYALMAELWKASDSSFLDDHSWQKAKRSPLVVSWWSCFVLKQLILVFVAVGFNLELAGEVIFYVTCVIAALSVTALIREINDRQRKKRGFLGGVQQPMS